jgi:hypothetical protein
MTEKPSGQPRLADLVQEHLAYAWPAPPWGEVEPHQASTLPRWSAAVLWPGALAAGRILAPQVSWDGFPCPAAWREWVEKQPVRRALPFCLGLSPRFLADLQPLLAAGWTALLEPQTSPRLHVDAFTGVPILDAALSRLAGQFEQASSFLDQAATDPGLKLLVANERATLLFEQHRRDEAAALWDDASLSATPVGRFNRGLVQLMKGSSAVALFDEAARAPLHADWSRLAELYRCLAEIS